MHRRRRILLNSATAVSLVLCAATVALWVRSYWVADRWNLTTGRGPPYRYSLAATWAGGACVTSAREYPDGRTYAGSLEAAPGLAWPHLLPGVQDRRVRWGFGRLGGRYVFTQDGVRLTSYPWSGIAFPLWAPAAAFAAIPLYRVARFAARRRRVRAGLCPACGYDLRATPEQCPECGTVATSPPTTR